MTRGGRGVGLAGRVALALGTIVVTVLLVAPVAAASPETDADAAITSAWERAGGDSSVLGAKQGDVYPVGDGFAQNFAGGKMFYTPATGAHALYGAILDKYESLGGPAGSDLGFPTTDEVPGLIGPDSRVSLFAATDKPVIFWTPQHGAFVVRGAINAAWDKLGSSGGALGAPVSDETYDGELAIQKFSGGQVSWNRLTKVFTTVPPELANQLTGLQVPIDPTAAINTAWRAAGGASGPLGAKKGEQHPIGDTGIVQDFAGGKVYFSPATGANAVEGAILAKYESLGGPVGSDLGFPIANETDGGIPASRISRFSAAGQPVIFWTPQHGAFVVRGAMKAAWDKLGAATGVLGAPVGDQAVESGLVTQRFTGGTISWNPDKNTFSTVPASLASQLTGLQVPGQSRPSGSASMTSGNPGKGLGWHSWWLKVTVPVLLLIGLAVLAALWRGRRASGRQAGTYHGYNDYDEAYPAQIAERVADAGHAAGADAARRADRESATPVGWPPRPAHVPDEDVGAAHTPAAPAGFSAGADAQGDVDNPDAVDTAPTRVPSPVEVRRGRHAAVDTDDHATVQSHEPPSGRAGRLAIHLPLQDPYQAPDGYPIKATTSGGTYYTPDNPRYEEVLAEIWFASEEAAQANGFIRAS
ncbi:LGFP repeat-containing protein [Mycobacterium sp. SM1]|uniref:LGFP repeat-containing protein n=1 Tax=Mycobacterium sp. SM1 TaxID=2816243 RepID=UPI0035A994A2